MSRSLVEVMLIISEMNKLFETTGGGGGGGGEASVSIRRNEATSAESWELLSACHALHSGSAR